MNGLVQTQIQKLQSNYPYVVVDNEAGMEHISRGLIPTMEIRHFSQRLFQKRCAGSRQNCGIDERTEFQTENGGIDCEPGSGRKA